MTAPRPFLPAPASVRTPRGGRLMPVGSRCAAGPLAPLA